VRQELKVESKKLKASIKCRLGVFLIGVCSLHVRMRRPLAPNALRLTPCA
jgi:hypothetical protein